MGRPRLAEISEFPKMDFADYERRLTSLQGVLQLIQQAYLGTRSGLSSCLRDGIPPARAASFAALAGPSIHAVSKSIPIAAPDEHERAQHYLQRFWRRLPEKGQIVAFDRSWYGRVLVERVEGLAAKKEWRRAYREINEFERMLIDSGIRLVKLFLHITPDEQMRRFRDRLTDPVKRWKLSYEDFRNRARWADYETAIEDMMAETSTDLAPWHLIPANNKPYGRVAAFRILVDRLGQDVSLEPHQIAPALLSEAKRALSLSTTDIERASRPAKRKVKVKGNGPES